MDKKGEPKYVRFRLSTEHLIEEIATGENQDFSETVEMLTQFGLQFYNLVHKNFGLRPKYRTTQNGSEEGSR
jgi:hypothetical protein